ncbi:MAG TPA: MFS transporter [Myxococcota bacterium]|nr:MFS transporter [Myxococcota bacterium]
MTRAPAPAPAAREEALPVRVKAGFALGDHSINLQLSSLSLFFLFFLTEVAGLPPVQAGLVLLVGRAADAFTDPLMGRLSDLTPWRWGRRRPYFLLGALPFGATTALLWSTPVETPDGAKFAWYAAIYVCNTLASTTLAVPYMALLPELATDYDERTSLNTYRAVGAISATMAIAVGLRPLVEWLGGGPSAWEQAGLALGLCVALPWLLVYRVTWERPDLRQPSSVRFLAGARLAARNRAYRHLVGLFLSARIAVDVVGAMFLFYFTYWIGRPEDFPITLGLMLTADVLSLPIWMRIARRFDKRAIFVVGSLWWIGAQAALFAVGPEHPRALIFAIATLAGVGYAVADLMPWSMLGDVIDADELYTGERRDGLYAGFFTFLRKLGGATGVALAGLLLQLAGFEAGRPQSDTAVLTIRLLTGVLPALFLIVAIAVALGYPLSLSRHREIAERLAARRADRRREPTLGRAP